MRTVQVNVITKLIIQVDEGVEIGEVLDEMEYDFNDTTGRMDVMDMEILSYEVVDSR